MATKVRLPNGTYASATAFAEPTVQGNSANIPTTGTLDFYVDAPIAGFLKEVQVTPLAGIAASGSNYVTFTITNLGQAGAGTAVMLAATDVNTTKTTALVANSKFTLTPNAVAVNKATAKGDRLKITATVTGTITSVTVPTYMLTFGQTA